MQTQPGQHVMVGGNQISLQPGQQPQIIVINNIKEDFQLQTYNIKRAKQLGYCQVCIGILLIIFNMASAIISFNSLWQIGAGWWGSPFVITAGCFAVVSTKYTTKALIRCTLAFSIISSIMVIPLLTQSILSITSRRQGCCGGERSAYVVVNSILLVVSILELPASMYQSILCCLVSCKCCKEISAIQTMRNQGLNPQTDQTQFVYYNPGMTSNQDPQLQFQQMPQQQQLVSQQYVQQQMPQQQFVQQHVPQQQDFMQQHYTPQAGASSGYVPSPTGLPPAGPLNPVGATAGATAGLQGPGLQGTGLQGTGLQGAEAMDLPPPYEQIGNNQNFDSKINEWAASELQLGKN